MFNISAPVTKGVHNVKAKNVIEAVIMVCVWVIWKLHNLKIFSLTRIEHIDHWCNPIIKLPLVRS